MSVSENKIQLVVEAYNMASSTLTQLGKQIKGLGDESVQAGQKSKNMLDGLKENWIAVTAAIAGAAVTINKAVELANLGAKAQQAEDTFKAMADAVGESADDILRKMKAAANGTVDDTDIMLKAAKGLSQGLSGDQMVRIMDTARVAARIAGQDVTQTYETITDAIANKMPRALLRYGLVTKDQLRLLDAAVAAGVADINLYELAMANGAVRIAQFGGAHEDAAEKIQKLKTVYNEFIEEIGKKLAGLIMDVQQLNNNLESALRKAGDSLLRVLEKTPLGKAMKEKGIIVDHNITTVPSHTVGKYGLSEEEQKQNEELEKAKKKRDEIQNQILQAIALKKQEVQLQMQLTDLDIKEKEESVSHVDAARERLNIIQKLYNTQTENQGKINLTAPGGEQKWEEYQKAIGETAKKLSEAKLAYQDLSGTMAVRTDSWIKQQQAADAYASAVVDVAEAEEKMSKSGALRARRDILQDELVLLEMQTAQTQEGSRVWYEIRQQIEQVRGQLVGINNQIQQQDGSFSAGFGKGLSDYVTNIATTFQQGVELARQAAQAMEQAFSDFFFDAMNGKLKNFSDYIKSFLMSIARAIANMMAQKTADSLASSIGSAIGGGLSGGSSGASGGGGEMGMDSWHKGGIIMHTGGYIPRFHVGGLSSDERPAILQTGEGVLSRKGMAAFDAMNSGRVGGSGGISVEVNIENKGQPVTARQTGAKMDGKKMIVSVVMEELQTNMTFRSAIGAA